MTAIVEAYELALSGRLHPTDLALNVGELTCLIGPNGSGKTSLLHALARIGSPSGEVAIAGIELRSAGPEQRQSLIAFLPATRDIKWPVSAADVVALGLSTAVDRALIDEALAALDLLAFADRRMDRMSTGERSRVLIARALVGRPRLLLLDEPIANLDPLWQLRLLNHLRASARANDQAIMIALHDLELARRFADRLIVMRDGRIAADGKADAIMSGVIIPEIFGVMRDNGYWQAVL